ncbi:MAG: hypothetical protein ABFD49_11355 [Armatimonadota bacterium]|nr:hypothetical protein [bacterium]
MRIFAAAIFFALSFAILIWTWQKSGLVWSRGLAVMVFGLLVYASGFIVFSKPVIRFALSIAGMAFVIGGGLVHSPEFREALLHGDPEDENESTNEG